MTVKTTHRTISRSHPSGAEIVEITDHGTHRTSRTIHTKPQSMSYEFRKVAHAVRMNVQPATERLAELMKIIKPPRS